MRYVNYTLLHLLFSVICLQQAHAQEENKISIPDLVGMESSTITLPIYLDNTSTDITGLQFDLTVPQEVMTLRTGDVTLSERKSNHAVIVSSLGNGKYRFMVYSPTSSTLKANSGELITIGAQIADAIDKNQTYPLQLSNVSIGDTDGNNVATGFTDGTFKCISCPDFTVSDIQWNKSSLSPGDILELSWKVSNIGNAASQGGWSERIIMVDASGAERYLGTCYNSDATLDAGSNASRTASVTLPLLPGLEGSADVRIELLPNSDSGEGNAYRGNNTAQTTSHGIMLSKNICLTLPKTSITEGEESVLRCKLTRSGHTDEAKAVTLTMLSGDSRVTLPQDVSIPQGLSTVFFDITLRDNDVIDNDSRFVIQASVDGYDDVQQTLLITDDELRHLTLTVSESALNEGDFFTLTVKTEKVMSEPITVKLIAEHPERLLMPETVTIAAHATQAEVALQVVDNEVIELPASLAIKGTADKHLPGECLIMVEDNDMPAIDLELSASTVSENATQPAVIAMLRRTTHTDREATILLSTSSDDILLSTSKITMKAGDIEKQFTINVKDNDQTDGCRQAEIIAAVSVSSCNCSAEAGTVGSVTKTLDITDDDGPALQIASSRASLVEGNGESATLTISRNTATNTSLTVTLSSDHDAAVTYPHTVTIPSGATSAEVTITLKDGATIGVKSIAFTAEAANHAKGSCWVAIAETPYPVAVVKNVAVSSSEVTSGGDVEVTLTIANVGTADLPENTKIEFYVDGKKQLYSISTNQVLAPGEEVTMTETLFLPEAVGEHQITFKVADSEGTGESASTTWTVGNSPSAPVTLTTTSPFTVTITPDKATYHQEDVVTLSGQLQGEKTARTDVQITLYNDDARQQLIATTDAEGRFTTTYQLRSLQAGHFTVSAGYPGEAITEEMASFDVYGLTAEVSENIELVLEETYTGSIKISNPGNKAQTNVRVEMLSESGTCDFSFSTLSSISAGATAELPFTITTKELSEGNEWQKMSLAIISDEGAIVRRAIRYYVQSKTGKLKSSTAYIDATMNVHTAKEYPIEVKNIGKGETGKISLSLPSWVTSTTPKEMASIAPGDSATVLLKFNPTSEMQLNVAITGQIGLLCANGEGTTIPFRLTPVSELKGRLTLDAVDELTFYTEEAPHLSNATVKVIHPATKQVVAAGTTDANGLFSVEIEEGWYNLRVEADDHDPYTDNIVVNAGRECKEQVFLKSNAISYDFDVEEIELEDGYLIKTITEIETSAPIPAVEVWTENRVHEPGEIFPVVVTNKGYFKVFDVELSISPWPGLSYEFLDEPYLEEMKGNTSKEFLVKALAADVSHAMPQKKTKSQVASDEDCWTMKIITNYNCMPCTEKEPYSFELSYRKGNCNVGGSSGGLSGGSSGGSTGGFGLGKGSSTTINCEKESEEPEEEGECDEKPEFIFKLISAKFKGEVKGVAADGVSQVRIKLEKAPKKECNYSYEWVLSTSQDLLDNNIITNNTQISYGKAEHLNTLDHFTFTAPENYPELPNETKKESECVIYAILKYKKQDDTEWNTATPVPIVISRVPVVFVHGLNSSPDCWGRMIPYLSQSGYYNKGLLNAMSYEQTHNDSFKTNSTKVFRYVIDRLNYYIVQKKIEVGKVDIVAHSMGGLLTKQDILYYGLDKYIHKFITINTPHGGSQLGNFMTDERVMGIPTNEYPNVLFIYDIPETLYEMFAPSESMWKKLGRASIYYGAVADLSVNSNAINLINKRITGLKCHAIATYSNGETDDLKEHLAFNSLSKFFGFDKVNNGKSATYNMFYELFDGESDCIVPLKSQEGGLDNTNALSLFDGNGSFAHTSTCKNDDIISKVEDLLQTPMNARWFADGFGKVNDYFEYYSVTLEKYFKEKKQQKRKKVDSSVVNFKLNSNYSSGDSQINVEVTHPADMSDIIVICSYQGQYISYIEGDAGSLELPQKILGDVVLLCNGRFDDGSWIGASDTISVNTIGTTTISKIEFATDSVMIVNDEYISPRVLCQWSDGVVTELTDALLFVGNETIAHVESNRWIYGDIAGSTNIRATYQGHTCEMPLNVYVCHPDQEENDNKDLNEICNAITLSVSQETVMTRQAFRARFTLNNGHQTSSLKNFKLNIEIHDQEGNLVTPHDFQVNLDSLVNFQGEKQLNSAWTLLPKESGKAIMTLIPTKYAAPSLPTTYSIGGSFSYTDPFSGLMVTREIAPVDILVNPAPDLDLTYFVQRDVFGDDPLTDNVVEPTKPAEFALIIHNKGNGNAKNVQFATAQPEIVENEKGLVVNYSIVSSQLNGQEATLALGGTVNTDFGTIAPHSKTYAQWWMESTLLGHFLDYDVTATHLNSYGNEDLSLLGDVSIHELIHGFTANSQATPPTRAFLVNDIPDNADTPDMLYFTDDQEEETVSVTSDVTMTRTSDTEYVVTITPSARGWIYGKVSDLTAGRQQLVSIVRQSDGKEIPVDNFWQTDRTLRDGKKPLYENMLHFIVNLSATSEQYLLTFAPKPDLELTVETYEGVPEEGVNANTPIEAIQVKFNKPIDESSFTTEDIKLFYNGTAIDASGIGISKVDEQTFSLALGSTTAQVGLYVLIVQTAGITDAEGFAGIDGKEISWVQASKPDSRLPIVFADAEVKRICVENWDDNKDGELSYGEAAAVTDLGQVFLSNSTITSFEELAYFTGLTEIPEEAFYFCTSLHSVVLPENLQSIGLRAFMECKLQSIIIPNNVQTIAQAAFADCGLSTISIPANVTSIGNYVFAGNSQLSTIVVDTNNPVYDSRNGCNAIINTSRNELIQGCVSTIIPSEIKSISDGAFELMNIEHINLPQGLERIGFNAFYGCPLREIVFPEGLTYIGRYSFNGCDNLTEFHVPQSVQFVDGSAIAGCGGITSISVADGNANYSSAAGSNAITNKDGTVLVMGSNNTIIPSTVKSIADESFRGRWNLAAIEIPESVESIGGYAFCECSSLTSIVIPKNVTEINEYAFANCTKLRSVTLMRATPLSITDRTFDYTSETTLYVPYGSKADYETANVWKEFKEIVEVKPDNFLYANEATIRLGDKKTIALQLDNAESLVAADFRLQLPAGLSIEKDQNGNFITEIVSARRVNHTLTVTDEGNGLYHFLSYSNLLTAFKGNAGDFITMSIVSDGSMQEGTYTATLKNIIFSDENEKKLTFANSSFNISVINYTPGDTNTDGNVDVMDVVKMVNYIMGRNPSDFNFIAADLDDNEKVNVMDLVNLIDLIMSMQQQASGISAQGQLGVMELSKSDDETVAMSIPFANRHVAAQFVVSLTDGAVLENVVTDKFHKSQFTLMDDGRYKVMVYSGSNAAFSSDSPIKLQLSGSGNVKVEETMFVDTDEEAVAFETTTLNTTGINTHVITFAQPADIYTVDGKLVKKDATSTQGLAKGVYVVNNQKVIVK